MSEIKTVRLKLQGPLAGVTKVLGGYQFIEGACEVKGDPKSLDGIVKYLATCYQAVPEGGSWGNEKKGLTETTLVLTHSLTGKTIELNGYQFTNGELHIKGPYTSVEGLCRYMARCYQAYPVGSDELAAAQEEEKNVCRDETSPVGDEHKEVPVEDTPPDPEPAPEAPPDSKGDETAQAGEGRIPSKRDGKEKRGLSHAEVRLTAIRDTCLALDSKDDKHWVNTGKTKGKPSVIAVRQRMDDDTINRADIEEAIPKFDRELRRGMELVK